MASTTNPPPGQRERLLAIVGELLSHDRWSRKRLLEHQRARLRALLEHAVASSPWYRETLGSAAPDLPLEELSTLSKAAMMEHFDEVVCDPRLRRHEVEAHMEGPDPLGDHLDRYQVCCTSGSTGLRGVFVYTQRELDTFTGAIMRVAARAGVGGGTRLLGIGAPSPVAVTRRLFAGFTAGTANVPRLSAVTPMDEMVAALNDYQPDALFGYPTIGGVLAGEQLAGRLRISPRMAAFAGETLTADIRRRFEEAWGFQPINIYAATEAPPMAAASLEHPELEVHEDLVILEVVDERNRPVPPGTPGAKVLLTNLVNFAQPLIRYELSDAVTMAAGPNPTGRPYQRIASVDGRIADTLYLTGARGGEVALHPSGLGPAFARVPAVRQFQLLHDERGLHARVVLADGADDGAPERVRLRLVEAIQGAGAVPPPIDVEPVARLERGPGPAAKLALIKSTVPSRNPVPRADRARLPVPAAVGSCQDAR
jgi:phenylacetate-CoA ligase